MTPVSFGVPFADYYDVFYADKDYASECVFIEGLMRQFARRPPRSIADIACGTGGHALIFAERGFDVIGVDQSAAMISVARRKAAAIGSSAEWHVMPMQRVTLARQVDVALCLFSSINYLIHNSDIRSALACVHQAVKPGGLFILDFLNGNMASAQHSPVRMKRAPTANGQLLRISNTTLDRTRNRLDTSYECWVVSDGRVAEIFFDEQPKRYFFLPEIEYMLEAAAFEVVRSCTFMQPERDSAPDDWYTTVVARRRDDADG